MSTASRRPHHPRFSEWETYFRQGNEYTMPVDKARYQKQMRGNMAMVVLLGALVLGCIVLGVWVAFTELGRLFTYIVIGILWAVLLAAFIQALRNRRRLRVGRLSDTFFTVSKRGMVVADHLEIQWEHVTGVLVADLRGQRPAGLIQYLLYRGAMKSGNGEVVALLGLHADIAKPMKQAAHPDLRHSVIPSFEHGWVQLYCDSIAADLDGTILSIPSAASAGGVDVWITENQAEFIKKMTRIGSGNSPFEPMFDFSDFDDETESADAAAQQGASAPALLERAVLTADTRTMLDEAREVLAEQGPAALFERFQVLDDGFDDEPSVGIMLTRLGQEFGSIIWSDWKGDNPGWMREQVDKAALVLGLRVPDWQDQPAGDHIAAIDFIALADAALQRAGQRLLLIDIDSDSYQFAPVTEADFVALRGFSGDGYTLLGAEDLHLDPQTPS